MGRLKQQAIDVLNIWVKNVNTGNVAGLMQLFDDGAILMPTFSANILSAKNNIADYFTDFVQRPAAKVEVDDKTIILTEIEDSLVILAGKYTFCYDNEAGDTLSYPARFSFLIAPADRQPIKHQHSSVLP